MVLYYVVAIIKFQSHFKIYVSVAIVGPLNHKRKSFNLIKFQNGEQYIIEYLIFRIPMEPIWKLDITFQTFSKLPVFLICFKLS